VTRTIVVAYVWDRGLSAAEVQALHANPYAMIAPQGTRRLFSGFPAAAGASAQPQSFVVLLIRRGNLGPRRLTPFGLLPKIGAD
jgi:hypothetical protein